MNYVNGKHRNAHIAIWDMSLPMRKSVSDVDHGGPCETPDSVFESRFSDSALGFIGSFEFDIGDVRGCKGYRGYKGAHGM